MRSLITQRIRPHHLIVAFCLYLPLAVAMFIWPGMVDQVAARCDGQTPLDMRAYWTTSDAETLLNACGAEGRSWYIRLQILDLAYPAASAFALLVTTALLLRRYGGRTWPLLLPPLAMAMLDYLENIGVWTVLTHWPEPAPAIADAAGMVTAVKRVAGFAAFSVPLVLAAIALARRARPAFDHARDSGT